jgi:hypothetical protein
LHISEKKVSFTATPARRRRRRKQANGEGGVGKKEGDESEEGKNPSPPSTRVRYVIEQKKCYLSIGERGKSRSDWAKRRTKRTLEVVQKKIVGGKGKEK